MTTPPSPSFAFIDQPFAANALCSETDPEAFFPDAGNRQKAAKRVCAACEVTEQCLAWATNTDQQWGIWGGVSFQRDWRRRAKETTSRPGVSSRIRASGGVSVERIEATRSGPESDSEAAPDAPTRRSPKMQNSPDQTDAPAEIRGVA